MRFSAFVCLAVGLAILSLPRESTAQTTYHLHKEVSSGATLQMKTTNPDAASAAFQSGDFKNQNPSAGAIQAFTTAVGDPASPGTIPSGAVVSFAVWMKKTANWGTFYPRFWLYLNNYDFNGLGGTVLCQATGASAITTSLVKYSISCTTASAIPMVSTDRWFVAVGINMTAGPGNHSVKIEVDVEGTLNGNFDSTVVTPAVTPPPPLISSVVPLSGAVGTVITVTGQNFAATQGTSSLKINNTPVTINGGGWSNTSISGTIPAGAATGPLTVTVNGQASNASPYFSVMSAGSISGTVSRASNGTAVTGAAVDVIQGGVVRASTTTSGTGQYATSTLPSGSYSVRVTATGLSQEIRTGVSVGGGTGTVVNVAMVAGGTVSGQVTSDGLGVSGAGIRALASGADVGNTVSDSGGNFTLSLRPGTYSLEASATGYGSVTQTGVVVADGGTTPAALVLAAAAPTEIRYLHDEGGRLTAVIQPTGESAIYHYDAVGNLLSIQRQSSSATSIIGFSPRVGAAGTTVTISGTGFSATPASNTVTFNGVSATVVTASENQLVVTVPSATSTGTIGITSPGGSATSSDAFTVGAGAGPSILSFLPAITVVGATVTVTGTNFQTTLLNNIVAVNGVAAAVTAATPTSLTIVVPPNTRSGRITVATLYGTATSGSTLLIAPSPNVAADVDVASSHQLSYGTTYSAQTPTGKISLLTFDGVAGQRVVISYANDAASQCGISFSMYGTRDDPYIVGITNMGNYDPLVFGQSGGQGWAPDYMNPRVLPNTGSYQIMLKGCAAGTASATIGIYDTPPDVTRTLLTDGNAVVANTTTRGQNALFTFPGVAGHRLAFKISAGVSLWGMLLRPGDTTGFSNLGKFPSFLDPVTLPLSSTYKVYVYTYGAPSASIAATAYDVPPDTQYTFPGWGVPLTATNTVAGQMSLVPFAGASGQHITMTASNCTYPGGEGTKTEIWRADGSQLSNYSFSPPSGFDESIPLLPAAETYTLVVDPAAAGVGGCTVTLFNVVDVSGSTTVNGSAVNVPLPTPGQVGRITFMGTAGQAVTVRITGNSIGSTWVYLLKPDGTTLTSSFSSSASFNLTSQTLATTGTYTVLVDPFGARTGALNVTVTNP
jgi:YD repeat-containing protein